LTSSPHGRPGSAAGSIAALLAALEEAGRNHPDRLLRLRGSLPGGEGDAEPFELLIFRGFSSLTTHRTDCDPDRPALPEGSLIQTAELLQAPLDPAAAGPLLGPLPVDHFLDPRAWRGPGRPGAEGG